MLRIWYEYLVVYYKVSSCISYIATITMYHYYSSNILYSF